MSDEAPRDPTLPDALTRILRQPRDTIWPTPDDRGRLTLGPQRPRQPSRAVMGVWLWAIVYNLAGFAILVTLWRNLN